MAEAMRVKKQLEKDERLINTADKKERIRIEKLAEKARVSALQVKRQRIK